MPLVFSNKTNPLAGALNSKLNPNPLQPPKNPLSAFAGKNPLAGIQAKPLTLTGAQPAQQQAPVPNMTPIPQGTVKPKVAPAIVSQPTQTMAPAPRPAPTVQGSISGTVATPPRPNPVVTAPAQPQPQTQNPVNRNPYPFYTAALGAQALGNPNTQSIQNDLRNVGAGGVLPPQIQQLADLRQNFAQKIADIEQTPIPLEFQQGREGVLSRLMAARETALQQGIANTLEGQGQQITALTNAGGLSNTQQSLAQQALQQAGSFAAPVNLTPGNSLVSPTTGQTVAGGLGNFGGSIQSLAQQVVSGAITPEAAASALGGIPTATLQLNQAIQQLSPGFSNTGASARGATVGDLQSQASNLKSYADGAEANFRLLYDVASQGGVLDQNVPILNSIQQNVQRGLASNSAVVNFQSLLQAVRSQYASIIGGGSTTVESLNEAKQLIPDNVNLATLHSLGENLKFDAQNRIAGITNQIQSLTGSPSSQPTNQGGSGSVSAGGYNFVQDANGNWVPAQ